MISAFDVDYKNDSATAARVDFRDWNDSVPSAEYVLDIREVEPYESGNFYKRELPCITALIAHYNLQPEIIVIDGYIWLDENKIGLGGHLYRYFDEQIPVIGVAKTRFRTHSKVRQVLRGNSKSPLYVSADGIELADAAKYIEQMQGEFRVPNLLKKVDRLCRGINE